MQKEEKIPNCPSCGRTLSPEDDTCPKCGRRTAAAIVFDTHGRALFAALVTVFWSVLALSHAFGWINITAPWRMTLIVEAGLWGLFFVFIPGSDTCSECGGLFKWRVPERCTGCGRQVDEKDRRVLRLTRAAFAVTTAGIALNSVLFFILCLH